MNVCSCLAAVREKSPLVHHLTNWVTIYDCAQVVKSFGASPVMAHAAEEVEEMAGIASTLVVNIGTLTTDFIESAMIAAGAANRRGIPVVLDVCGAGATSFRDRTCLEMIERRRVDIIKGNASEIASVAGYSVRTRGVDATEVNEDLAEIAATLARQKSCVVVVTGAHDIVAGGSGPYVVKNGCAIMSRVVGTGCMAASVISAFAGACPEDIALAAGSGLACFGIAAEIAEKQSGGPGTFKERLFDSIADLSERTVESMRRIDR
jgi:hydroxyethylthiazole kinase